jgi:hypothetical protein
MHFNCRLDKFMEVLNEAKNYFVSERGESPTVSFQELVQQITIEDFSPEEILNQIQTMSDENMSVWYQPENESLLFF